MGGREYIIGALFENVRKARDFTPKFLMGSGGFMRYYPHRATQKGERRGATFRREV